MEITKTKIDGLVVIQPRVFYDDRGYFFESYQQERYKELGIQLPLVQDNVSKSAKGVIRGLHIQREPMTQGKLVGVIKGRILDVAVDCRKGSPTYGQYESVEITGENKKQFWIPRGFAHGFAVLEEESIFCYKCDNYYSKEHEVSIRYNDSDLGIPWPIVQPIVSEKDAQAILFKDLINYL